MDALDIGTNFAGNPAGYRIQCDRIADIWPLSLHFSQTRVLFSAINKCYICVCQW